MDLEKARFRRLGNRIVVVLTLAAGAAGAPRASAGDEPVEPSWEMLVAEYEPQYAAIVLHHDIDIKILFDTHTNMSTSILDRRKLAVFDADKVAEHLDLRFTIPPGYKVKKKKASGMEFRNGVMVTSAAAQDSDFHERKLYTGWREIRVAVPGLSKRGYVDVQIELVKDGGPFFPVRFDQSLYVREGSCRLRVPSTADGANRYVSYALEQLAILPRGSVEKVDLSDKGKREVGLAWKVADLPPRSSEPLVPADRQPLAQIDILYAGTTWKDRAVGFDEVLGKLEVPKKLVKSARDTLGKAGPEEVVHAVARYLDDHSVFKLRGNPRHLSFELPDLQVLIQDRRGDAFGKAVFASRLLSGLKVENHLVLAASRYGTSPDWRSTLLHQFSAVLISVPAISDEFLWDVAARWVPIGRAGSDLYEAMVVLDPERDRQVAEFPLDDSNYREMRAMETRLGDSGRLEGNLTFRYESLSEAGEPDPWDPLIDPAGTVEGQLPKDVVVSEAVWKNVDRGSMRCTSATPAVLACRVEREALPAGEAGWEVRPFLLELPARLEALAGSDRRSPLFLSRGLEITDTFFVGLEGRVPAEVAPPSGVTNGAGAFQCAWEVRENGIFGTRTLRVRPGHFSPSEARLIRDLCTAWKDSGTRSIVVE